MRSAAHLTVWLLFLTACDGGGSSTRIGGPAPDFTLRDLEGREVTLSGLKGNAVLLDFWFLA
jgi:hypothetical protein